jgi:hypothetical protein
VTTGHPVSDVIRRIATGFGSPWIALSRGAGCYIFSAPSLLRYALLARFLNMLVSPSPHFSRSCSQEIFLKVSRSVSVTAMSIPHTYSFVIAFVFVHICHSSCTLCASFSLSQYFTLPHPSHWTPLGLLGVQWSPSRVRVGSMES